MDNPEYKDEHAVMAILERSTKKFLQDTEGRLALGFKDYGTLDIANDNRDFLTEGIEEMLDLSVYLACKMIQLRDREAAYEAAMKEASDEQRKK